MASAPPEDGDDPVPTTEGEMRPDDDAAAPAAAADSNINDDQWQAFQDMLSAIYDHRLEDGHDPSHVFHRKVNRRLIPAYYEVIKEPIALSTIKARLNLRQYKEVTEIVRDFALIPHNAQVYNAPHAPVYEDALTIKALLESELKKITAKDIVTEDEAALPDLGEIPAVEDAPAEEAAEDEEENEDEDEEEEEGEGEGEGEGDADGDGDESDDSRGKRKGRKGRKSKTDKDEGEDGGEGDARKRRGRPPRVDTPMESRIKNILKGIRRFKNAAGFTKIAPFDKLPDKATMPEYYVEIKNPMAIDVIKKRVKRKKYHSVEQFLADLDLMFDNAKLYNEDGSEIFKDAVDLQGEARKIADEELQKPDTEYAMEDGRIPLPAGITHNGELYKIGDWVHIQNANDLTKPIVSQIYRTWQDSTGAKFVNACWYYRPEQTVHRFDRHFYDHEVVKTGQYRDHQIDEIVDRCFVMFITRFSKGRPRGLPADKEAYVCEARYNEEKHTFNKIKTWASCLPDEVRDKDYEMELFKEPKRMKKVPSPIAYLLKDEQKETDDAPKAQWGADNAPPKIGAVHRRPRDPKDSPPPEPTPPPPPAQPTPPPSQPARSASSMAAQVPGTFSQGRYNSTLGNTPRNIANAGASPMNNAMIQPRAYQPNGASPFARQNPGARAAFPAQTPQQSRTPSLSNTNYGIGGGGYTGRVGPTGPPNAAGNASYQAPQPVEVYHLDDRANALIPAAIRAQFQCDEYGHVLFFTAPPLAVAPPADAAAADEPPLAHSARYLAAMKRRAGPLAAKRARDADAAAGRADAQRKAARLSADAARREAERAAGESRAAWEARMADANARLFRETYGAGDGARLLAQQPWLES